MKLWTIVLTITARSICGQTNATLSGAVFDKTGAVVPEAHLSLTDTQRGFARETVSDRRGSYVFTALPAGAYRLRAEKAGFAVTQTGPLTVAVDEKRVLQLVLEVSAPGSQVNVSADLASVSYDPSAGVAIDRHFVENLPLNGRSFQSLIELTPGVVTTGASFGEGGQFSVNGQRSNANYYTVDGVSANTGVSPGPAAGQSGSGSTPGFSALGTTSGLLSVDALQEFRVQTSSFAPEFGRTPGAQVSMISRGGSNQFHGTLSNYFRNDALDANDWFANRAGLGRAALRQNDFGGVLGGPIATDRAFFFLSYEGLRLRQPQTSAISVPSIAARQSALPGLSPYLNAFPVPNGRDLGNGSAQFSGDHSDPSSSDSVGARIDLRLSERWSMFGRYGYSTSETHSRGAGGTTPNSIANTSIGTHTATAGAVWVGGGHTANDLRLNYTLSSASSNTAMDNYGGAVPLNDSVAFPSGVTSKTGLVQVSVDGAVGYALGSAANNGQKQWNLVDSFSWALGGHQLKFGGDYRRLTPTYEPQSYSSSLVFNGISGGPGSLTSGIAVAAVQNSSSEKRTPLFSNYSFYAQDTWTVRRRVTLTYGLRWEINPAPEIEDGLRALVLTDLTTYSLRESRSLYKSTYANFAPRFGVAAPIGGRQGRETVLRFGGGIFYDLGYGSLAGAFNSAPYSATNITVGAPVPLPSSISQPPALPAKAPYGQVTAADPNLKLPLIYQWNAAVERQLGAAQVVSVTYAGSDGRKLLRQQTLSDVSPSLRQLALTTNSAVSTYHSLQLQYRRRLAHDLQVQASYAWSHSIDTASTDSSLPGVTGLLASERGNSTFDVRHNFSAAGTYKLPAGRMPLPLVFHDWFTDLTFRSRTALPYDVESVGLGDPLSALAGSAAQQSRADYIGGGPLYISDVNAPGGRRLNRSVFAAPKPGAQGSLGRGAIRGFGASQLDLAIRKQFALGDRLTLHIRAEAYNLFNHPNFANPDSSQGASLSSPDFGVASTMLNRSLGGVGGGGGLNSLYQLGGPRSLQLSVRIRF